MSLRTDMLADVATIHDDDGETVTITTRSGPVSVVGFWRDQGFADGRDLGPAFTVATSNEPADLSQRNTLKRASDAGDASIYTITTIERTAAGQSLLVLISDH